MYYYLTACGGVIIGDVGVVQSPNYPNPYPDSTSCYWDIVSTLGTNISITFDSQFEIENSNNQCEDTGGDYLLVNACIYQINVKCIMSILSDE